MDNSHSIDSYLATSIGLDLYRIATRSPDLSEADAYALLPRIRREIVERLEGADGFGELPLSKERLQRISRWAWRIFNDNWRRLVSIRLLLIDEPQALASALRGLALFGGLKELHGGLPVDGAAEIRMILASDPGHSKSTLEKALGLIPSVAETVETRELSLAETKAVHQNFSWDEPGHDLSGCLEQTISDSDGSLATVLSRLPENIRMIYARSLGDGQARVWLKVESCGTPEFASPASQRIELPERP